MLPQHFEPYNLQDNRQLGMAFKKGRLPHLEDKGMILFILMIRKLIVENEIKLSDSKYKLILQSHKY